MKLFKSLLLASATGLVAVSGASAADLGAKKPSPVEFVKACYNPLWGTVGGFVIPGTQTCLRISGRVRVDYGYVEPGANQLGAYLGTIAAGPLAGFAQVTGGGTGRNANATGIRARAVLNADAITQTEVGALRSYFSILINGDRGVFNTGNNAGAFTPLTTGNDAKLSLDKAFIQFAGITAGRAQSFFDFAPGFSPVFGVARGSDNGTTNLLAYSAILGNGISATISLEDADGRRGGIVGAARAALGVNTLAGYGGTRMPDVVANLRVDQAWGSAQLSGIAHQVFTNSLTNNIGGSTKYGFAVQGGVKINLPALAAGDYIWLQAAYAEGVMSALGTGGYYANGVVAAADAVLVGNGGIAGIQQGKIRLSKGYTIQAGFNHQWTSTVAQTIFGSYTAVDQANFTVDQANAFGRSGAVDFKEWRVGSHVRWTPVAGLLIGAEVIYVNTSHDRVAVNNFKGNGLAVNTLTRGGDSFEGRLRIQRDF